MMQNFRTENLVPFLKKKRFYLLVLGIILILIGYFALFRTLVFDPLTEKTAMTRLEFTKGSYQLAPFTSDGCSAGVSSGWSAGIEQFSRLSESFSEQYQDVQTIPFESACITHDRFYHAGVGDYAGRLEVDNQLRADIIQYGIQNAAEIQTLSGLSSPEQAMSLYEIIAEAVYKAVRLGGAPCTGEDYAWGYGYNRGSCLELD